MHHVSLDMVTKVIYILLEMQCENYYVINTKNTKKGNFLLQQNIEIFHTYAYFYYQ